MPAPPRPRRGLVPFALVAALAALAALVVFAPVVGYGFAYDDSWTVVGNSALDSPLARLVRTLLLGRGVAEGVPDATRPAMVLSLWVDRRLFGPDPAGYHLHSLLLYALSAALSAFAVFAVTRRRDAALVGAMLFALSPVHAEVVAAINYREDLLAGVAVLATFSYVLWPRRKPAFADHVVIVAAVLVVGLLAKESAIVVVPLVLVVLASTRSSALGFFRAPVPRAVLGGAALVWCTWRLWLRWAGRDDVPLALAPRGPVERLLRTARYLVRTVFDGLVPLRASPEYAPEPAASPLWVAGLAVLIAATVWLVRRRRSRALGAGLAIALVAGLPTSPLVSPINETADRYVFLAVLGGAIFWGELGARLGRRLPRRAAAALLVAAALPLAHLCRQAAAPWTSDLALFRAAAEKAPGSARAFTGLSRALRMSGDLPGADRAIETAIRLDPTFLRARITRLYNSLARGDVDGARRQIEEIRALGGERQVGFRQAVHCATLVPEAAALCARRPGGRGPFPPRLAPARPGSAAPDGAEPLPM